MGLLGQDKCISKFVNYFWISFHKGYTTSHSLWKCMRMDACFLPALQPNAMSNYWIFACLMNEKYFFSAVWIDIIISEIIYVSRPLVFFLNFLYFTEGILYSKAPFLQVTPQGQWSSPILHILELSENGCDVSVKGAKGSRIIPASPSQSSVTGLAEAEWSMWRWLSRAVRKDYLFQKFTFCAILGSCLNG